MIMPYFSVTPDQNSAPAIIEPKRAALGMERWLDALNACDDSNLVKQAKKINTDPALKALLETVFSYSPYLTQSIITEPEFTCALFQHGPERLMKKILATIQTARKKIPRTPEGTDKLAALLRQTKRQASLAIALADISGVWELAQIMDALSELAEASISAASAHLLIIAAGQGAIILEDAENPERGSGLVILGMGKLGSRELNYSSDVDLIILYDPDCLNTDDPEGLQNHFVRLARGLVKLLDERTADGYVFRTDLRLRPDPAATPIALSVLAAESYYESIGQNWERAAMIKARPVGGDKAAGEAFLKWLTPFIWRKNLDFSAIEDIHSIKRQINAHRGGKKIAVNGHNIKLGRGGIREIEFFAQTQQLIWGGRLVELRRAPTEISLTALAKFGQITEATRNDMIAAYRYLRRVEHRLQMINDEQTHSIPEEPEAIASLAAFLGYLDTNTFTNELASYLKTVESHYSALFEGSPSLGSDDSLSGNLVFTGGDSDPETIKTIKCMGFDKPDMVDRTVRGWHHGRYRSMRNARSRELLTELFPVLLKAIAGTQEPDATFLKFDEFLGGLPSGVQLFSMFYSNPSLLDLVAEIMGGAPRLAEYLSRRPQALEIVLTPGFFEILPSKKYMSLELNGLMERAGNIEDVLVATRRWANDRRFQVGVLSLLLKIDQTESADALSNIADSAIIALYKKVEEEMEIQHGRISGSAMAILAMGKLGSQEMTPESDLDLVFVYDLPENSKASDGSRPLSPGHYFARLSQRFITAMTSQTSEGDLYEVDMRLRPSGTAGPIASSLVSFKKYNNEEAWTWEQMALTRSRIISAPDDLANKITRIIHAILTRQRDPDALLANVVDMRKRMLKNHKTDFIWDVKHIRGGLVDVEFITQFLLLRHAHQHPDILARSTKSALEILASKALIDPAIASDLLQASGLWNDLQGMLRLTIPRELRQLRQHEISESLRYKLARISGAEDYDTLLDKMAASTAKVLNHFNTIISNPAKNLTTETKSTL
jgi:glutamate-ammonia-ligase adenylyltransferase